jgi:anaerobic magnesium-protoporphyrin IX monomethyl ester cyclase
MKFLLLNSPIYRTASEPEEEYLPPLGLGYIATHIDAPGVNVKIIDCVKEHLGVVDINELFSAERPDYIGMNVFTQNYEIVKEIVENCRVAATIIIGGQVVKCVYPEILEWKVKNNLVLVIGEGELLLPTIISGTCTEKPIYSATGRHVYRVDKNSCYFPDDLSAVKLNRAFLKEDIVCNHYKQREASIITSRGCMYNCTFCGGARILNQDIPIRCRDIEDVGREIGGIVAAHPDVKSIRVLDDLFLRNAESIKDATRLFQALPELTWRGMAHVLTFGKSINMLPELKASGCRELFVGIESGSDEIRRRINKPGTPEQVVDAITALLQSGIDVKGYFMYGFPSETVDEADETYTLASKLKTISRSTPGEFRPSAFQFRPYHGTQLYNEIIESGHEIGSIRSNKNLNMANGRSQFNFQSGNYSEMDDSTLDEYILKTQQLSEVRNV